MEISEWVAVISVVIALLSLSIQQYLSRRQSKAEARTRHYERTQTLLLTALNDTELLESISGNSTQNQKHRRYWQLWINHIEMIFRQRYLFDKAHWHGTENDIKDFMSMPLMLEHWKNNGTGYSPDFQEFINEEILEKKAKPHINEAPPA